MRVADHRAIDFHRTLVELAPRVLVRPREAQFAQRVQDAQPFRGGRDLRQIAADMPLFKRSDEHTSELQSLLRISYAVFCLKNKQTTNHSFRTRCNHVRSLPQPTT